MDKKEKKILKEDIEMLEFLVKKYSSEKKFEKATNCQQELNYFKEKLKGVK